jgi:hypothetical protein
MQVDTVGLCDLEKPRMAPSLFVNTLQTPKAEWPPQYESTLRNSRYALTYQVF